MLHLPTEIILQIAGHLTVKDLDSACRASRALHHYFTSVLYRRGNPLVWAAERGREDTLRMCLAAGCDMEARESANLGSWSAVYAASQRGHEKVLKILLEHGADIDGTLWHSEVDRSWWDSRKHRYQCSYFHVPWTPLQRAVSMIQGDHTARLLIANGADVNQLDFRGATVLHKASLFGWTDVVAQCLEAGADVDGQQARTGRTALHYAVKVKEPYSRKNKQFATVETLLRFGASVLVSDTNHITPLDVWDNRHSPRRRAREYMHMRKGSGHYSDSYSQAVEEAFMQGDQAMTSLLETAKREQSRNVAE